MAGFDFEKGASNNMLAARERGMVNTGTWGKKHGVSARAVLEVMRPTEAHHTGTGRRGKSWLTPVLSAELEPTAEQLAAMQAWDRFERSAVRGWYVAWRSNYSGPRGRERNVPVLEFFEGDPALAPRDLRPLSAEEFVQALPLAGCQLKPFAQHFSEIVAD